MMQTSELQVRPSTSKTLQRYKKRLLLQVILVFVICLIIILERVFYEVIVKKEESTLSSLQLSSGLIKRNPQTNLLQPDSINAGFLKFFAMLGDFHIQFLILTHVLATIYVSVDSIVASKLLYVTMGVMYLISLLQMFYGGGRPFWESDEVLTSACLNAYNHPSLGLVLFLFFPIYTFYCWRRRSIKSSLKITLRQKIYFGVFLLFVMAVQFFNYFLGEIFIINIAMSFIFTLLIYMGLTAVNSIVDKAVKKSTIMRIDAKKYVFYWLLFICLLETFVLIVYSGLDLFLDIDWVQNYLSCTKYLEYQPRRYKFDEVIGPWFSFIQTSSIFAWIGGIFGIAACFRNIDSLEWSAGTLTERVKRATVTNFLILPSWAFVLFLEIKGTWIEDIGLNEFITDGIHFFILYIWIFGYMPILVLHKWLRWTNRDSEDFFVITRDKSQTSLENGLVERGDSN